MMKAGILILLLMFQWRYVFSSCTTCLCNPSEKQIMCIGPHIQSLNFNDYWIRVTEKVILLETDLYTLTAFSSFLNLRILILKGNRLLSCQDVTPFSDIVIIHDLKCAENNTIFRTTSEIKEGNETMTTSFIPQTKGEILGQDLETNTTQVYSTSAKIITMRKEITEEIGNYFSTTHTSLIENVSEQVDIQHPRTYFTTQSKLQHQVDMRIILICLVAAIMFVLGLMIICNIINNSIYYPVSSFPENIDVAMDDAETRVGFRV